MAVRMLPAEDIDEIVRDSPEHLVDIIADVLLAFLLKMNVPVPEAEDLTDKVREKRMAELFENMEKLDIQVERRKVEEQKKIAEAAIALLIEGYQDAGMSREEVLRKLMEKLDLDEEDAKAKVERCQTRGARQPIS